MIPGFVCLFFHFYSSSLEGWAQQVARIQDPQIMIPLPKGCHVVSLINYAVHPFGDGDLECLTTRPDVFTNLDRTSIARFFLSPAETKQTTLPSYSPSLNFLFLILIPLLIPSHSSLSSHRTKVGDDSLLMTACSDEPFVIICAWEVRGQLFLSSALLDLMKIFF